MLDNRALVGPIIVPDIFRTIGECGESGVSVLTGGRTPGPPSKSPTTYVMSSAIHSERAGRKNIATNQRVAASYLGFRTRARRD